MMTMMKKKMKNCLLIETVISPALDSNELNPLPFSASRKKSKKNKKSRLQ